MALLKNIYTYFKPPNLYDEDKNRIADILNIVALSILTGFISLIIIRVFAGSYTLLMYAVIAAPLIYFSGIFLRKGKILLAELLLLGTLLSIIAFLLYIAGSLHNIAILGIPICLVFAGIALSRNYYIAFTFLAIITVITIGLIEIANTNNTLTVRKISILNIIDVVIILIVTAFCVRILADRLIKNIKILQTQENQATKHKRELIEYEEKFKSLTEELPNVVYIYKEGKLVYINDKCKDLIGYTQEELYSNEFIFFNIFVPEYREIVEYKFQQQLSGKKIEPYECILYAKDEKRIECFNVSKLIHYENEPALIGIITDLTEIKRAQESIRYSQSKLSSIISSAMEAIITVDKKLNVQSFNPAAEQMLRCLESEAIGQSIKRFILFNSEDTNISIARMVDGKIRKMNGIRVNGEMFPIEASISKIFIGREEIYTIIFRDITERVKAEETQRNLQAQLMQSQKMEAVGTMAGGIAHDFNNILSVIIGNAELVKQTIPPKSQAIEYIDEVLTASDRAQELVQQILAFSRKQDSTYRPIRLNYIIKGALKLLRSSILKTIDVKIDLPENGPLVMADATQIHQVIMNLCTNAAQAMEGTDGVLTLRQKTSEFDDRSILFHPDLKKGKYAVITIQDTGIGMDQATQKKIFEPFFTTKEPGKGTGLGLSIVHAIIKNHNGAIKVHSQVGKGTQIDIFLPIYEGNDSEISIEQNIAFKGGSERILVIDDEVRLLNTLSKMLKSMGYNVFAFSEANQALQEFTTHPNAYDLVITDQAMPHINGIALAEKIHAIKPSLPIILMTGYNKTNDAESLKNIGIKDVMLKPFKKSALCELLQKVFSKENQDVII